MCGALPREPKALLSWLFARRRAGVRPSLAPLASALDALGRPDAGAPAVQVVGTVGKGSVSAMLASILEAGGRRVGLFTSPHLVRFEERVRVAGREVTQDQLFVAFERVVAAAPWAAAHPRRTAGARRGLTFFEWAVLLAALAFHEAGVEVVVWEAGLGGRWDGTTAARADQTVLTPIARDHEGILGPGLAAIAAEKAAALRPGVPAVSAAQVADAAGVIEKVAAERGTPLTFVDREASLEAGTYREGSFEVAGLRPALAGDHQRDNATLAIFAARHVAQACGWTLAPEALRAGVSRVRWPGRLQWLARDLLCDGMHNRAGAEAVARALPEITGGRPLHLVFGCLRDRDPIALLEPILPLCSRVTLVAPPGDRALAPERYQAEVAARHPRVVRAPNLRAALESGPEPGGLTFVCGSLYLVGALLAGARPPDPGDPGHLGALAP